MGFGRPADFRFRRRFRGSPMVEVWNLFWGGLTAVFGEWLLGRRRRRFGSCFEGSYPPSSANPESVAEGGGLRIPSGACNFRLRRAVDLSPKTEVGILF